MADDTDLNPGIGGDKIRTVQKGARKTQAFVLDMGGAGDESFLTGRMPTSPSNFAATFRESFTTYISGQNWQTASAGAAGDILQIDGNSAGASYLVISKSPLDASGAELEIESLAAFEMPFEVLAGIHLSQRTLGQEFSFELVSTETPGSAPSDLAIASIQQATTTLTVGTVTPHNLKVGARIGIAGVTQDSRLNYSALVVASTPSATQFTCTAGPGGAIPSLTVGPFASGVVYARSAMDFAVNGTSMLFENATATTASYYVRNDGSDPMPVGGTFAGAHGVTGGSTASIQPVASFGNYNFRPTTEFRLAQMVDRLQWQDVSVDANAQAGSRAVITQVIPNNTKSYKIRFRARNNKSFTVPNAKIVSVSKTGTTTATVITDGPHGLTTGDFVNTFGVRDQTNFANLAVATVVASVINANSFTIVWGAAVTATSYGGFVARVNGGQVMQGMAAQSVQSATITGSVMTLVGSAAWAGVLIGDYVNAHGLRDASTGADLGVDGAFRVRDIQTTSLVLEPIGGTVIPSALVTTNCGGAVIKRTDMRISFVRLFDFERLRIEALSRPAGDIAGSMPVQVSNVPGVSVSGNLTRDSGFSDSSTNLAAAATFTGTGRVTTGGNYAKFNGVAYADVAGTLFIDLSVDTGAIYRPVASIALAAQPVGFAAQLSVPVTGAQGAATLYRVRYVNGAGAQAAFQLSSSFSAA